MLTKIYKAGEEFTQPIPYTHYVVDLKDRDGKRHRIKCIEVPYITSIQLKPDYSKVQDMFPCIPEGSFDMPSTEIQTFKIFITGLCIHCGFKVKEIIGVVTHVIK